MARYPAEIAEFMQTYGVRDNEVWPVPGGKSFAVKHSALERIAAAKRIEFQPPQIVEGDTVAKTVTLVIYASMGDIKVWSFGEVNPTNNKNAYVWSMAEKRGKDRCILKLLNIHGALYSSEELDNTERDDAPAYEPPGDPPPVGEVHPQTRYAKHATEGLSQVPSKGRPAGWDDAVAIINGATDFAELQVAIKKPHYVNTTSAWSNHWLRKLADGVYLPKVATFRGAEFAAEMQRIIHAKYPLDRIQEAAE